MLNPGYTSIDRIVENVIRDTGFTDEISFPDIVEWVFIAMELIDVPNAYIKKVTDGDTSRGHYPPIEIVNYRGELPCDFHRLVGLREYCVKLPLIADSGTFLQSSNDPNINYYSNITYTINNNYIFTNIDNGVLEMSYYAFPTDEEGLPMIPNDIMYIRAIESYLTERIGRRLWLQGKMEKGVYASLEQDWLFYVKAASVKDKMPDYDHAESLKNQVLRLVQRPNQASWNYSALTNPEQAYTSRYRKLRRPFL